MTPDTVLLFIHDVRLQTMSCWIVSNPPSAASTYTNGRHPISYTIERPFSIKYTMHSNSMIESVDCLLLKLRKAVPSIHDHPKAHQQGHHKARYHYHSIAPPILLSHASTMRPTCFLHGSLEEEMESWSTASSSAEATSLEMNCKHDDVVRCLLGLVS